MGLRSLRDLTLKEISKSRKATSPTESLWTNSGVEVAYGDCGQWLMGNAIQACCASDFNEESRGRNNEGEHQVLVEMGLRC